MGFREYKIRSQNIFLKPEKCQFHKREVEYLSVIIWQGEVKMNSVKVEGIDNWPTPEIIRDVYSFLGFCNFYCSILPSR